MCETERASKHENCCVIKYKGQSLTFIKYKVNFIYGTKELKQLVIGNHFDNRLSHFSGCRKRSDDQLIKKTSNTLIVNKKTINSCNKSTINPFNY